MAPSNSTAQPPMIHGALDLFGGGGDNGGWYPGVIGLILSRLEILNATVVASIRAWSVCSREYQGDLGRRHKCSLNVVLHFEQAPQPILRRPDNAPAEARNHFRDRRLPAREFWVASFRELRSKKQTNRK